MENLIEKNSKSLRDLLEIFRRHDDGLIELPPELAKYYGEMQRDKIDATKRVIDDREAKIAWLKSNSQKFREVANTMEEDLAGLKKHMADLMKSEEALMFKGVLFEMKLIKNSYFAMKRDATPEDLVRFPEYCREKIEVTYEWDKKKIEEDLAKNPKLLDIAEYKPKDYIRFNVKKD